MVLSQDKENLVSSNAKVLRQYKARANSINSMLSSNFLEKTSLQDKPEISIGTRKYQVGIGFGGSNTKLSLVFDTASQLTWTQCQPCSGYCYDQKEPIFNPLKSSSYASIRVPSVTCNQISSEGFLFGCGQRNHFPNGGRAAGVLGLGRGWFSIVSQTSNKYPKVFSYCLPSSDESTGYLKFGDENLPSLIKFTPMSKSFDIRVGGERLSIDGVGRSFVTKMTNYPMASAFENLGTCYYFSGNSTVVMPTLTLYFDRGVEMPIDARGILYINKISQTCLEFEKNNEEDDVMIVGNFQ
ncbi:putative Leucine-rich repeat protein kinase family protein [Hibiscus syriacus]|uniref:Leucine-rich repeat protein kinase family protein n=1 Tax=Hibiscus syriacus TaxID=106335 RepID=A0A6A3APB8_HIBSY|nr:putative Leucine-rich repeat protein kinase family protein [Hibiscus syriacus]